MQEEGTDFKSADCLSFADSDIPNFYILRGHSLKRIFNLILSQSIHVFRIPIHADKDFILLIKDTNRKIGTTFFIE